MKKWFIFLFLVGCKVSSFTTIVSPNRLFGSYKSFSLVDYPNGVNITQPEYDNPENRKLINKAIIAEMNSWGLNQIPDSADILVTYMLLIQDKVDTRIDSAVVYKPWLDTKQDSFNYTEGALTLLLVENSANKIIAQSQLIGVMDRNPEKFKSSIPRTIKMMFKKIKDEAKTNANK